MAYDKQNKNGEVYPSIRARIRPEEVSILLMCRADGGKVKTASTPAHFKKAVDEGYNTRIIVCNVMTLKAGVLQPDDVDRFYGDWIRNMYNTEWWPDYVEVSARGENVCKQDEHPSEV